MSINVRDVSLLTAALLAFSYIPTTHALYCYDDGFNIERCSALSPGARAGIGIAIAAVGLLAILMFGIVRQRRIRRANAVYVNNAPGYPQQAYPMQGSPYVAPGGNFQPNTNSGYNEGYYPSYAQPAPPYPQYPPPTHSVYDPQSGFAPPYQLPKYSPPQGPPPEIVDKTRP